MPRESDGSHALAVLSAKRRLNRRYRHEASPDGGPPPGEFDLNSHVIPHRSNYDLAKIVVYTEGKTPEETRDSVLTAVAAKA